MFPGRAMQVREASWSQDRPPCQSFAERRVGAAQTCAHRCGSLEPATPAWGFRSLAWGGRTSGKGPACQVPRWGNLCCLSYERRRWPTKTTHQHQPLLPPVRIPRSTHLVQEPVAAKPVQRPGRGLRWLGAPRSAAIGGREVPRPAIIQRCMQRRQCRRAMLSGGGHDGSDARARAHPCFADRIWCGGAAVGADSDLVSLARDLCSPTSAPRLQRRGAWRFCRGSSLAARRSLRPRTTCTPCGRRVCRCVGQLHRPFGGFRASPAPPVVFSSGSPRAAQRGDGGRHATVLVLRAAQGA